MRTSEFTNWQQQAAQFLAQGNYARAAELYEQAIEREPEVVSYYWNLGLILLLQGQEAEAQTTWLFVMAEGTPEQVEEWTLELVQVLHEEAERQALQENYALAWAIRQHIREIVPDNINNLLLLVQLAIKLDRLTEEELAELGIIEQLRSEVNVAVNPDLLLHVLGQILDYAPLHPSALEFAEVCVPYAHQPEVFAHTIMTAALEIAHMANQPKIAVRFAELCLHLQTQENEILKHLAALYQNAQKYEQGIETAKLCFERSHSLADRIFANHLIIRGLMTTGGHWEEAGSRLAIQESLVQALVESHPLDLDRVATLRLMTSCFFFPYYRDDASRNRLLLNQIAELFQANVGIYAQEQAQRYQQQLSRRKIPKADKPLRLGYVSHCMARHSVGWLARWLLEYHDRSRFELYGYFIGYKQIEDPLQQWYEKQMTKAEKFSSQGLEVAEKIYEDEIDILIDLDSITLDITCEVMALKPAPIQVTWLGWDGSGLPAIDYYIADSYVLPESAQDYYAEKIWRLPETYVAVDGFEVGVPTLRRDQLNIPDDAVVYFSAQRGYKRHPNTAKLQIQILQEVPNSYLLIKGLADEEAVKKLFTKLAEEMGVSGDRLRFLPGVGSEPVHRANLTIADVVLDTFPYNGATTTLETLWMGVPLVTRVGEQFASRNSYTMMMNAGITEGIAWTDEEYVEWGIRLGKDSELRQQVAWKLLRSRQTAPLWNAKKFTRQMEEAYEQMWQRFLESSG